MLSAKTIDDHISNWEKALSTGYYAYRAAWPSRLFHHAPIENAVRILKDGQLMSRNASEDVRVCDIAGRAVIQTRSDAHDFARLYFRPKTPTQYHVEGIRKPGEYWMGEATTHAPILIMFVFDLKNVLLKAGTAFSTGNMQSYGTSHGSTEELFSSIDFQKVYHEGGTGGDRAIIFCRCAEVLCASPLALKGSLQWIYCRSQPERQMLLGMLGSDAKTYSSKICVSDDIRVFEKKHTYVEDVRIQKDGVIWRLNPRFDGKDVSTHVTVRRAGRLVGQYGPRDLAAFPPGKRSWIHKIDLTPGFYDVVINLEGCLAFEGRLSVAGGPF